MVARPTAGKSLEIKLAHSPDSDDAFMFYGLATHKVRTPGMKFIHTLSDIETLNRAAEQEEYDVTAMSFHAYAYLHEKYALLDCGASFGERYGPIVVAPHKLKPGELAGRRVAVPGMRTTATLALRLIEPRAEPVPMPFDRILQAVQQGADKSGVEAGVLIHEGQLLYSDLGLQRVVDLGQWWWERTQLPLPLGANAIRRALGPEVSRRVARAIRQSVTYALEHREEALNYAMQFARDMDFHRADKFVGMYVNRWTLGYGEKGRQAVRELLRQGAEAGALPAAVEPEILSEDEA